MTTRVLILGAGFGGLELSTRLAEDLADDVEVTLIDKNDAFVFGFTKLDVMFGRRSLDQVRLSYRHLAKPNVVFRQETVLSIDAEHKQVVTDQGTYEGDILVIALGADVDPGATPGLAECGHEFYTPEGAARVTGPLAAFDSGNIVVAALGGFFKCPPAPYEACFMTHDLLTRRGRRDTCTITLVTPTPRPIGVSEEVSNAILSLCADRDIRVFLNSRVTELDPAQKSLHLEDGTTVPFDLLLGIPVHRAPQVVVDSGLTDDGWIAVDKSTLATKWPGVYAVGDITSLPAPRAGVLAEGAARTVADGIIAKLTGGPLPPPFPGEAMCYLEMGDDTIGKVNVNFFSGPAPTATFTPPSIDGRDEAETFAADRRRRWFGLG